ncbi:MAG: tape measure protein, partial [Candidatus Methylumidiphilus sp.]
MADLFRETMLKLLINAQDNTGAGVKSARGNLDTLASTAEKVSKLVAGYLTYQVVVNGVEKFIALGDTYKTVEARIKTYTHSMEEQVAVQGRLFDMSQDAGAEIDAMARLYAKVTEAGKAYNATQADVLKLSETVALSFKAQGSTAAEVNSTITQLTQALSGDVAQWQDFGPLMDTNLKLVNVAAKNLGYDGIGALKKAMSDSEVSGKQLSDALVKGFDEIKAAADAMPTTASQAMTKLNNALLMYVGQVDKAHGITTKFAGGIEYLSQHVDDLAQVAQVLATLMLGKLAVGLTRSTAELITNTLATRAKAAADREAAIQAGIHAEAVTKSALAVGALNAAIGGLVAWEVGQTIGEWATQFDAVRISGSYVAQLFVGLANDWKFLTGAMSDREYYAAVTGLHDEFNQIREGLRQTVVDAENAQKVQTEQVKQQQAAQREAFTLTESKLKDSTKLIEEQYKRQTDAATFGLSAKKAAIEGSVLNETVQAQRLFEAEKTSLLQR